MANRVIRVLPWMLAGVERRLCTMVAKAAEEVETKAWKPLYRRLSALGKAPKGSVVETLNGWLREGRAITFNELMKDVRELRRYKRFDHALELMDWMEKRSMTFNEGTHAIRIDLISKVRGIDAAESYFNSLPEVVQNQLTYGALLSIYCQVKMEDKAIAIYEKMKELNLTSRTLVHNNLLALYSKLGQPEKALSKLDDVDALNQCFEEWESAQLSYDIRLVNVVIGTYLRKGMIKEAEFLWEQAKQKGADSDFRTFDYFIDYYLKHDTSLALKCLEAATDLVKHDEWKPKQETVTGFLKHIEEIKDVDRAQAVYKCLKKLNCLDSGAYEYMLQKT
ncbi:putative tetratricopeptide-like helical domain superfamily [Dioscorea sansibarensis]